MLTREPYMLQVNLYTKTTLNCISICYSIACSLTLMDYLESCTYKAYKAWKKKALTALNESNESRRVSEELLFPPNLG